MEENQELPLEEKIRIFSRIIVDVVERNNIKQASNTKLSVNQFLILRILYISETHKVSDIADFLHISRPAASKNIDYLVRKRLIKRREMPGNRRAMAISLLPKGRDIVQNYIRTSENKTKTALTQFSSDERELLNSLLDKYIRFCLAQENDLSLFCLQCGGEYNGKCLISPHIENCYFHVSEKSD